MSCRLGPGRPLGSEVFREGPLHLLALEVVGLRPPPRAVGDCPRVSAFEPPRFTQPPIESKYPENIGRSVRKCGRSMNMR